MDAMKRTLNLFSTLTLTLCLALGLALAPPSATAQDDAAGMYAQKDSTDLVSVIKGQDDLTTLADALEQTGLAAALSAGESYTVFAPTDDAFNAVDLAAMGPDELATVLRSHVVSGAISATDAAEQGTLETLQGGQLAVAEGMVNGTAAIQSTLQADNGVIHVIDAVLSPAEAQTP